ncbi:MAG TPA: hypothetical protein VEK08_15800 [Planctomycetota bacterium]|nr:hypothetical protein [Planctomycetota bacterium]
MSRALLMLIALLAPAVLSASEAPARTESSTAWERYKVVVQRNMFSKDRGRREERKTEKKAEKEAAPAPKPETEIVLTGVVKKDGELIAFLENRTTGAYVKARPGDAVARGKVTAITLDSIEYTVDTSMSVIKIGQTLEGGSAPAPNATAPKTDSATDSIIERLRKKRQEALSK